MIKKFQQGGQSSLPAFVSYRPVVMSDSNEKATVADASSSKSSDKGADLTDKDLMSMLKSELDGLPNDVAALTEQLSNFYLDQQLGFGSTASIETRYLKALSLAKTAKFNKAQFDKALERSMSTGGINEVAIDENGQLICALGNDFKRLTVQQYIQAKNSNPELHALTNQELLQLRANSPMLQFDSNIAQVVQNSIGMESVNKLINDAVRNLGSDELKREGYTATEQSQIKQGIEYLQKAQDQLGEQGLDENTSVDGLYNLGVMTKDQAKQAMMALNYLYTTLPKNAKALLDMKAAESGMGTAKDIIQQLLGSRISRINTQDLSRTNSGNRKENKSSSDSSGSDQDVMDKLKLSPVMMAQLGKTSYMPIKMQNGTKYAMTMNAQVVPIVNTSGAPLGTGVSLQDVSTSQYAGALDFNNATIGGQAIDPSALDRVIVDSTNLYIMNLPYTTSPDGTIMPDLKWLKTIETIDTAIREQHITDINKINELYQNAGLPALMDSAGNLNVTHYCKFGVLNGKAASSTFTKQDDFDITAKEINDENLISNYLNQVNKGRDKDSKIDFDPASFWDTISPFWNDHDSLYEGTIYMPFRDDILNGALSSNQELTAREASVIQARNQQKERMAIAGGYNKASMEL